MAKVIKKIDYKKASKISIMEVISQALIAAGYEVGVGENYGFTSGTIVAKGSQCDIQIKPITPKAGVDRYEPLLDEEVEVDAAVSTDPEEESNPLEGLDLEEGLI